MRPTPFPDRRSRLRCQAPPWVTPFSDPRFGMHAPRQVKQSPIAPTITARRIWSFHALSHSHRSEMYSNRSDTPATEDDRDDDQDQDEQVHLAPLSGRFGLRLRRRLFADGLVRRRRRVLGLRLM